MFISTSKATSSSSTKNGYDSFYAVDTNNTTSWVSGVGDTNPWITVDLGSKTNLVNLKIVWDSLFSFARIATIDISIDGIAWETIKTIENTFPNYIEFKNSPKKGVNDLLLNDIARFIKVKTTNATVPVGIKSIEISGTVINQYPNTKLSLNKNAVSSVEDDPTRLYITDLLATTTWESAPNDDEWIYIDLGENLEIQYINILWNVAYAEQFDIQISRNSFVWETLKTIKNEYLPNSNDPGEKWLHFKSIANGKNKVDIERTTRFIKFLGKSRISDTYRIANFEVFGRTSSVSVPDIPTTTDTTFVKRSKLLKYGQTTLLFNNQTLIDFIFKQTNFFTSIYPTNPGSTYSPNIKKIETTNLGVYLELNEALPVDIMLDVLLSRERLITHVSVPPSVRFNEVNFKHDISYLNLPVDQFYVIAPINIPNVEIRSGFIDKTIINLDIYGFPWTSYFPIRLTLYQEPHIFNTPQDNRLILSDNNTYQINQVFHTPNITKHYKDLKFKTNVFNYVPVSKTTILINTVQDVPFRIENEAEDGDLVALDTPIDATFTSNTINSRLEPFIITTEDTQDTQISITLYRRVSFDKSKTFVGVIHDYEFVNKQMPVITDSPNRNIEIFEKDNQTNVKLYGKGGGTIEFKPITWTDEISTGSNPGLTELFKQNVNIISKKGINFTSEKEMYMDNVVIDAKKLILGGGIILEFTVDTNNSTIVINNYVDLDGIKRGTYTIQAGSLQLENFITFDILLGDTEVFIQNQTLVIVGYENTSIDIEKYIPPNDIDPIKLIQINKFSGIGNNSSITVNASKDSTSTINLDASNVNISGLTNAGDVSVNDIITRNLLKNNNLEISTAAQNIIINTSKTSSGAINFITDNLKVSMDKRFTLVDDNGEDVIVSKDSYIFPSSFDTLNISKIKDSTIPSLITIDTIPNTKNIYNYLNSGKVLNIGKLTSTKTRDETIMVLSFNENAITRQDYLDKIYPSKYLLSSFGLDNSDTNLTNTIEQGQTITKTFMNKDKTRVLIESYKINIDTNITEGEVEIRPGLSYKKTQPLTSVETITKDTIISTFDNKTQIRTYTVVEHGYVIEKATFKFFNDKLTLSIQKPNFPADILLNNTQIGEYIIPGLTDGEITINGNKPVMKTQDLEYTVYEENPFFETSKSDSGLKTVHGTFLDTDETSITTKFCRNIISSEYQDPETYDSHTIDVGIIKLTPDAVFEFDLTNGIITKSNFKVSEISAGVYTFGNVSLNVVSPTSFTVTPSQGTFKGVLLDVQRTPIFKPHGRHNRFISPELSQVVITPTTHTETVIHKTENIYDIKYIGPESFLDFYCEGIWYPQLKINNTEYLDTYITYLSGTKKTKTITNLAVNPFENKQSIEEYKLSLVAKEKTLALMNAGVSITNSTTVNNLTERKNPIENTSSLAWIKSKTIGDIDYIKMLRDLSIYTTLFEDETDIETIINTLKNSIPEKTENLRRALFDISPVDIIFDKYVIQETSAYTQTNNNWSKGLHIVGEHYISEIKKAIAEINGITELDIDALKTFQKSDSNVSFSPFYGVNPESDFDTTRVLSLGGLLKEIPNKIKPGRWIKVGNTVWISADITIPESENNNEYTYTVAGNPFEKLIRGTPAPVIDSFEYDNETHERIIPSELSYIHPTMVPEYLLTTADSPFPTKPNAVTQVNTDGTICICDNLWDKFKYSEMTNHRHKFTGTFNIIETFPDLKDDPYTIPQEVDLTGYNYTLDDSGQETFDGYKLKGSSASYTDGIYIF